MDTQQVRIANPAVVRIDPAAAGMQALRVYPVAPRCVKLQARGLRTMQGSGRKEAYVTDITMSADEARALIVALNEALAAL